MYEKLSIKLLLILVIAGLVSYLGGMLMGTLTTIPYWAVISGLVVVGLLVYLKGLISLDDIEFFDAIILFVLVGVIGTIVTTFVPAASGFILSATAFTPMGLGWTLLYIALGEVIVNKIM